MARRLNLPGMKEKDIPNWASRVAVHLTKNHTPIEPEKFVSLANDLHQRSYGFSHPMVHDLLFGWANNTIASLPDLSTETTLNEPIHQHPIKPEFITQPTMAGLSKWIQSPAGKNAYFTHPLTPIAETAFTPSTILTLAQIDIELIGNQRGPGRQLDEYTKIFDGIGLLFAVHRAVTYEKMGPTLD